MFSRKKIVFVAPFLKPFIQEDLDTLEQHYVVRKRIGTGPFQAVRVFFAALGGDLVICWFASVYAAIAVIAARWVGVKSIVIVGGVDAAKEPQFNYGMWNTPWKSRMLSYALPRADKILPVEHALGENISRFAGYDGKNIFDLPTGYDSSFWKPLGEKEPIVLTVASARGRIEIKGLDTLVEAARLLPEQKFLLIGTTADDLRGFDPPPNITFIPELSRTDLLPYYRRAKIYCQPSRLEGMPNTLCEAMLCAAIPVVTDIPGHRTAVGTEGIFSPVGEAGSLAEGITQVLKLPDAHGMRSRARIVAMFPKEKRERELLRIVGELIS